MCRVTVLSLEFLLVRSNRISMCRVTVWSLEFLFVRGFLCVVLQVLSLESLFVRSNRISVCRVAGVEYGISICTVK